MTDKEIIKALEHCANHCNNGKEIKCNNCCAFVDHRCMCKPAKLLDLIRSQQAEIERLKSPCEMQIEVSDRIEQEIRKQAVREFAEKLKKCTESSRYYSEWVFTINESALDNLVKEFVKDINVRTNPEEPKGEENE